MPAAGTFAVDTGATFASAFFMGSAPKLRFGSTEQDVSATGERKWWLPISSEGAMGSPVYDGETLLVSVNGHDQPWMTTFESALSQYDKDGDGRISRDEFKSDKEWFEFFGWIDDDSNGFIDAAEWKAAVRIQRRPGDKVEITESPGWSAWVLKR